jgi:hypothetical protein
MVGHNYYQNPYQHPAYMTQPLQPPYDFGPGDFLALARYAETQPSQNASTYTVAPAIATYATARQRAQMIAGALPEEQASYRAGVTVSLAAQSYPASQGGVGMVTSPYLNGARSSAGDDPTWHTVGLLRQGNTAWVYDPAHTAGSQTRLPMIPGTTNVGRLLGQRANNITLVQVQGIGSPEQDCMGRSAQWVDNVIRAPGALAPYPAGFFVPGQVSPGWEAIRRT